METLVAISILVVAISGAFSAAQTSISSSVFSKDQIIAFYLAQEGIEQIRNMRDENGLNNNNHWLRDIARQQNDECYFGKVCRVDTVRNEIDECSGGEGSCPLLRQNPNSGLYGYDVSWPATKFRREITLTSINANEISILVTVTWAKGLVNREFRARENIFNWH